MDLEKILKERKIPYQKTRHARANTARQLAMAEHVRPVDVAKPVLVKGDSVDAMCVLAADDRLDMGKAAEALHQRHLRLATEDELARECPDCEVGAEPPIGSLYDLPTIVDKRLARNEVLVMQAGTHTNGLRMKRADWERLTGAVVADIAQRDQPLAQRSSCATALSPYVADEPW